MLSMTDNENNWQLLSIYCLSGIVGRTLPAWTYWLLISILNIGGIIIFNNCYFSLGNVTQKPPKDLTQVKGRLACKGFMKTAVMKIKKEQRWLCMESLGPLLC